MNHANRMGTQNVRQFFGDDHERLDALFHQFQAAKPRSLIEARRLFSEFRDGLDRHIAWEEEILFPLFDKKFGHLAGSPTEILRWEHWQIRQDLRAISRKLVDGDLATETEELSLHAVLASHSQKEDTLLYPVLDEIVTVQEQGQVFAAMQKAPFIRAVQPTEVRAT